MSYFSEYYYYQIDHADYQAHDNFHFTNNGPKYENVGPGYVKHERLMDWSPVTRIVDEQFIARLSSFFIGVFYGVDGAINNGTYAVQEFIGGVITGDPKQLFFVPIHSLEGLVHIIALPIIGIFGVFMPKTALHIAGKIEDVIDPFFKNFGPLSKLEYGPYSIRAMSFVKGFTLGVRKFSEGVRGLILSPFLPKSYVRAADSLSTIASSFVYPIIGTAGIVFSSMHERVRLRCVQE